MRWSSLVDEAPRFATLAAERLTGPGVALVATIRRDGSPRISPVEPLLWRDDLWLSMLWGSTKAGDLAHDPRILAHSVVTARDGRAGELKVRGEAVPVDDAEAEQSYAEEVERRLGWRPVPGRFHLFRVEVADVTFIRYDDATGDQFVVRWPAGEEYVRRGTSATSLGAREAVRDLLVPRDPQASGGGA